MLISKKEKDVVDLKLFGVKRSVSMRVRITKIPIKMSDAMVVKYAKNYCCGVPWNSPGHNLSVNLVTRVGLSKI